jgi:5-methylcytosine-specific restriction endonuclease McrA
MAGKRHPREHGTIKGFNQYKKKYAAGEKPCQPCKDARAEYMRDLRRRTPENQRAGRKRRYANLTPEKKLEIKLKHKEWYAKNREYAAMKQRENRASNPNFLALHRATGRRRRARIRNQGFEFFTEHDVLNKYGTICHICNQEIDIEAPRSGAAKGALSGNWKMGLHIDHVIPIIKGGSDTLDNVRPAHAFCNLSKGAKILGNQE